MSLAKYSNRNHSIPEEQCWDILFDMLAILVPMHSMGLCHNDIKPDNILITSDSQYKLCDFGLCCDAKSRSVSAS